MDIKSLIPGYRRSFNPLIRIQGDFNQLFDDLWKSSVTGRSSHSFMLSPSLDMEETDKEITLHMELPGLEEKDIAIELKEGMLSIRGEKKIDRSEENKSYHMIERATGSFMRSVELHMNLIKEEGIEASFKNGVLTIHIPKAENAVSQSRQIAISSSSEK